MNSPILSIVVPCFNEEEVLPETQKVLASIILEMVEGKLISRKSKIVFVDDGSRDRTWEMIDAYSKTNNYISGIKLSRNVGHQKALLAGLMHAKAYSDCILSIDADLQDDTNVIKEFVVKYLEGYEVVYGVRKRRDTDTFFKRFTAEAFYKFMSKLGVDIIYNHADFRLTSKRVLNELQRFEEVNLFLRGIFPVLGFKTAKVYYDRKERFAGESKYPLKKMLSFAMNGITSFSVKPIRMITILGTVAFVLSIVLAIFALVNKILGNTQSGWTSLMVSLWFIGGVQLISLGLIGEYIGKIYGETKRRPLYIVEQETSNDSKAPTNHEFVAEVNI